MTTAPVFLVDRERIQAGQVLLDGPEGRHAAGVRRLGVGERLDLVDGTGRRGQGVVEVVHDFSSLTVAVATVVDEAPPAASYSVVQALPKGDRGELAVELMTEAGVDEVLPWSASRCVTKWSGDRGARALGRWRSTAAEAAKQSRRARWPVVTEPAGTSEVARRCAQAGSAFVLHEDAEALLAAQQPAGDVLLVVGPEGGITPAELDQLVAAGARPVRLGPEVVRTSTAGVLGLAVLSARQRWAT